MKNLIITLLILAMAGILCSQTILREGFEGETFPPEGWTMLDADGDGRHWNRITGSNTSGAHYHNGEAAAASRSWMNGALSPDNWLITPQLAITAGMSLSYWVSGFEPAPYDDDYYQVLVSTTDTQQSSFTMIFHNTCSFGYTENVLSLNAYAGHSIYIAFRHWETDVSGIKIDDVKVSAVSDYDLAAVSITGHYQAATDSPTTHFVNITNEGRLSVAAGVYTVNIKIGDTIVGQGTPGVALSSGESRDIPVVWTYPTPEVVRLAGIVVWQDDQDQGNNETANLHNVTLMTPLQTPYEENFNTAAQLTNWTQSRFGHFTTVGYNGTGAVRAQLNRTAEANRVAFVNSPFIGPVSDNAIIKFRYRFTNYSGGGATVLDEDTLSVFINGQRVSGGVIDETNHTPTTDFTEFILPIPASFVGQNIEVRWVAKHTTSNEQHNYYVTIDDFEVYTPRDYDLAMINITGALTVPTDNSATHTVTLHNRGILAAVGYTIALKIGDVTVGENTTGTSIPPNAFLEVPVSWDTPVTSGEYQLTAHIVWAEDQESYNNTITPLGISAVHPYQPPFIENFTTSTMPPYWTNSRFGIVTTAGVNGTPALRVNMSSSASSTVAWTQTPFIGPMTTGAVVSFKYRFANLAGTEGTEIGDSYIDVLINGQTIPNNRISSANHTTTADFRTFTVEIPDSFADEVINVRLLVQWAGSPSPASYYVTIDDMEVYSVRDYELVAKNFTGTIMGVVGEEFKYTMRVINYGVEDVLGTDYTIQLKNATNDAVLTEMSGVDMVADTTATFTLVWTPTTAGTYDVYGYINYPDDENLVTNSSTSFIVTVLSPTNVINYIGDKENTTLRYHAPYNSYFNNSLSQELYLESEIPATGVITHLGYTFRNINMPEGKTAKIYMATTDIDVFTSNSAWFPASIFTLVYDGEFPTIPAGETRDIFITLDNEFEYTGGNLIIMTQRNDNFSYNSGNTFHHTATSTNRLLTGSSSTVALSPDNLPTSSIFLMFLPNIQLVINTSGTGTLAGNVTSSVDGGVLDNVQLTIEGTTRNTLSDSTGAYSFTYLPAGDYTLNATLYSYYDYSQAGLTVPADGALTHNFTMTPRALYQVSGTIIASDTEAGLGGVTVTLDGYADYQTTTAADGTFSFPAVYDAETYNITVSITGYVTYTSTVEVDGGAVAIPAITIIERAFKPFNLVAVDNGTNVSLTWHSPIIGDEVWFTQGYFDVPNFTNYGNASLAWEAIPVHRYTPAQLDSLDVAGEYLSKIAVRVGLPSTNANYEIRIYTGGSIVGQTITPGELVYTQPFTVEANEVDQWLEVELASSFLIPSSQEVWIGYRAYCPYAGFAIGANRETANSLYGNIFFWNAGTPGWNMLADGNFAIKAMISKPYPTRATNIPSYPPNFSYNTTDISILESSNYSPDYDGIQSSGLYTHTDNFYELIAKGKAKANTRAFTGYNLYRTTIENITEDNLWIEVATGITDTFYVDTEWETLPANIYRYVVKAVYQNGVISLPTFSNALIYKMESPVTITVTTSNNGSPLGSTIRLQNNDEPNRIYTHTLSTSNTHTFPAVWLGTYTLTVYRTNYAAYVKTDCQVIESQPAAFGALLTVPIFLIREGFEGTTFPPTGWETFETDTDGQMWKHATNIPNDAHGGNALAYSESWISMFGLEIPLFPQNYLVTPPIRINSDATSAQLAFWVGAQDPVKLAENYSVLVSTDGNTVADFTEVLYTERISTPGWMQKVIILDDYIGEKIYIAFFHHDCMNQFRLKLDDIEIMQIGGTIADEDEKVILPLETALIANYPNPFNPSTTIEFGIRNSEFGMQNVTIDIYNIKGQKVRSLVNTEYPIGKHTVIWNGTDDSGRTVSSGVYFYRMKTGDFSETKKMILMK